MKINMRTVLSGHILVPIISMVLMLPVCGFSQKKIAFEPSPVNFTIKNAGLNVNGSMSGLEGFVTISAQHAEPINIEGSIDPNTIRTGIGLRDSHLKKETYFNVKEFPKIFMTSTRIKKISENQYTGDFELTIKGIKKTISTSFTFSATGNSYMLKGEFSINRLDFKVGENSFLLADNVKVKIDFKTANQ